MTAPDCGAAIRAFLTSDAHLNALVFGRVAENFVPLIYPLDYLWFAHSRTEYLDVMDQAGDRPFRSFWALECCAETVARAAAAAEAVRQAIATWCVNRPLHLGSFGGIIISWVSVTEQHENYAIQNAQTERVIHVTTLEMEIVHP